ncbi:hypothetical protein Tco_1200250 [Tanacetum coccineum]
MNHKNIGKVKYCEDEDDCFTNFNTEFPAIVSDDTLTALSCESTVSPLNENEIDFRISFDESDDEEYMVIFDENSFSYKIIYVDELKSDSEKDNDKINMPSFPSPEPTIIHSDDLDFFKDFENEFPSIIYNDDLTSKLTEPSVSFQHIKEFDLDEETSFSEYDEEEQNNLYFNDLFPLNVVFPNDLKSDKDIDADEIDVTQSSGSNAININTKGSYKLLKTSHSKIRKIFNVKSFIIELIINIVTWNYLNNEIPLSLFKNLYVPFGIPFNPKRYYKDGVHTRILRRPRYQVERYTKDIMHNNEQRLEMIFGRSVNRVYILDFVGLTEETRAPLVREFILEFLSTCRMSDTEMGLDVADTLMISCSIFGRGQAPEKGLRGLSVVTRDLPMIDLHELSRLNIYERVGDTWAWVALGPERQTNAAAGAPRAAEDALAVNEGAQANSALMQAPQPPIWMISYSISGRGQAPKKHAEGRKSGARLSGGYFIGRLAAHFRLTDAAAGAPRAAEDALVVNEGAQADPTLMQAPQPPPTAPRTMP